MKKKHFLLYFSIFLLSNAFAFGQDNVTKPVLFSGYRIGGDVSGEYASIDGHLKNRPLNPEHDVINPANENFATDAHHTCRKFHVSPGFELGVFVAKDYYLGLSINYHNPNAQNVMYTSIGQAQHFEHQLRLKSYTNLFLKFGYRILPKIMFYGLCGPSFANWSHKSTTFFYDSLNNRKTVNALSQVDKKSTGFGAGVGAEFFLNKKYSVSLSYSVSMHKAKKFLYPSAYSDDNWRPVPADVQKSVRLSYSTIGLRFSYFFSF